MVPCYTGANISWSVKLIELKSTSSTPSLDSEEKLRNLNFSFIFPTKRGDMVLIQSRSRALSKLTILFQIRILFEYTNGKLGVS